MVGQRLTLLELQLNHIHHLIDDLVEPTAITYTEYVWQPLPLPTNGRVTRAIAAYTA